VIGIKSQLIKTILHIIHLMMILILKFHNTLHNYMLHHLITNQTKSYLLLMLNVVVHVLHLQPTYKRCKIVTVYYLQVLMELIIQLNHLLVVMFKIQVNMKIQ